MVNYFRDIVKEKLGQQRTNPILPSESILFGTRGLIQHRKTIGNPLANILAIGLRSGKASKVQVIFLINDQLHILGSGRWEWYSNSHCRVRSIEDRSKFTVSSKQFEQFIRRVFARNTKIKSVRRGVQQIRRRYFEYLLFSFLNFDLLKLIFHV